MTRTRIRPALVALPLAALIALVGCGSQEPANADGDKVATADGTVQPHRTTPENGADSSEPLSEDELHDRLLAYAQCLRDQGLDVEDPAPGQGLQLDLEGDPSEANAALEACKDLAPPQPPGEEDPDAVADMLAYAQCMRDNGVEAFEDPEPGEGLSVGPGVADDPDFPAAEKVCSEQLPGKRPETHRSGS